MSRKQLILCDICEKEVKNPTKEPKQYNIIFDTEQTEGRGVKPYFTKEKLDLCEECLKKLKDWNVQILGSGAMGYNRYKLIKMYLENI